MSNRGIISPFRYPGAKSRLAQQIFSTVNGMEDRRKFVDVFVGGGSVSLHAMDRFDIPQFSMNDKDQGIAAFWSVIASGDVQNLCRMIMDTTPTVEEHARQRTLRESDDELERAFSVLFLNRTSFSGIVMSGPIGGTKQESKYSVACRYNAKRLVGQIESMARAFAGRLTVSAVDFEDVIASNDEEGCVIYCDPPYYAKGGILYPCQMDDADHRRLASCLKSLRNASFIVSYDNAEPIRHLYRWAYVCGISARYSITGQNRESWRDDVELLIHNMPHDTADLFAE